MVATMFSKVKHAIIRKQASQHIQLGLFVFGAMTILLLSYQSLLNDSLTQNKSQFNKRQLNPPKTSDVSNEDFLKQMKQRMEERRSQVQKNCQKLGLKHNKGNTRDDLVSSEQYKTIFCPIPKTGITHWKIVFTELIRDTHLDTNSEDFSIQFKRQHQIRGAKKYAYLSDPKWVKMIVVREPFERLVSAYRSKLETIPGSYSGKFAKKIQKEFGDPNEERESPTFSTFVNYLVETHPHSLTEDNVHWTKYTTLCQPCDLDYDLIGHQETVAEDSKYILQHIGAPNDLSLPAAYQNHTNQDMVYEYYSSVQPRHQVLKLYKLLIEDYIIFGYPPPPVLKRLFGDNYSIY